MPSPSNLRSLERPIMKKEPTSPVTSSFEGVTNNRPPKNLCEIVKELKRKTEPPPRAKLKQETIVEDVTINDDDAAQQTTTTTTTRIKVQPNSERSDPVPASAKSKKLTPPNETAPTEKRRQGSTGSSPDLSSDEDSPPHKKPVPMIDLRTLSKCQKPYQHHHASREEDNSPSRSLSKCQKPYHHHHASREGDTSPPRMMVLRPMPQDRKRVSTREQHLRNQLFHVQQGLIRPRNIGELQQSNSSKQGRSPLLRRSPPRRPVFHPRGQFNGGPSMRTSPDVDHPHHLAGNGSRTSNSPRTSPSCPPNSPWPPHSNNLQYPRKFLEVLHRDDSRKLANTSNHDQVRPSSNQHSGHHHMSTSVAPSSGSGECCGHRQSVTRAAENIGNWSVAQVGVFLEKVGCGEYTNIFRKHKINGDSLPFLQLKTLLDLGLAMGHAHTIIARVHRLIGTYPDVLLASHNCNS